MNGCQMFLLFALVVGAGVWFGYLAQWVIGRNDTYNEKEN